jgi:hypothetical protein
LKSVFPFDFEEFTTNTVEVEIEKLVETNREHQKNLQQLQAQLESVNEKRKNLKPICVKKMLEDYE